VRFSNLITKTQKDISSEDPSRNAQLLAQAGFIRRLVAGVYSYLPLGFRTLSKIENIIREEMEKLGAQEILMPALQPRDIWEQTGRWNEIEVLFKLKGAGDRDLVLGPTHEEVVTPLIASYTKSYRDLPTMQNTDRSLAVFQIQTKFRNEPRARSGLLRGREFRMKDMYSFHSSSKDLDEFYERAIKSYATIFERCGLGSKTILTYASGGAFSTFSHEFQTMTQYGEDTIYKVSDQVALNKEIISLESVRSEFLGNRSIDQLEEVKAIEVGNIFKLGTKFTDAFKSNYTDAEGNIKPIYMGCYGIGSSRIMGTIAECLSDERGLVWPIEVAPYQVHLVSLGRTPEEIQQIDSIYEGLVKAGIDTLYDDRHNMQAGVKLTDADLIGIPIRVVISPRTLKDAGAEIKLRLNTESELTPVNSIVGYLTSVIIDNETHILLKL
jgi:prolyl-tRNA synthetase